MSQSSLLAGASVTDITLANQDLQGYVVTQEAVDGSWYEASNAMLKSPEAGNILVRETIDLLNTFA